MALYRRVYQFSNKIGRTGGVTTGRDMPVFLYLKLLDIAMYRIADLTRFNFKWQFLDVPDIQSIETHICEKEHVWDTDNCGDKLIFYAIVKGIEAPKFYRFKQEYYWANEDGSNPGCYYGDYVQNDFEFEEVTVDDLNEWAKRNLKFVV